MSDSSSLIPQDFLDDLQQRMPIDQLVSRKYGVSFKTVGKNKVAKCPSPVHEDKTPSFNVTQDGSTCRCWGCELKGNVFQVVMDLEKVPFPKAVEIVANEAGVEMPQRRQGKASQHKDTLAEIMSRASMHFQQNRNSQANPTIQEMIKARGLQPSTLSTFGIGVAKDEWRDLADRFGGYARARLMSDAGLVVYSPKTDTEKAKLYDFFRNGLVFPVRDERGQTVTFARRAPDGMKPKYLNGPDTALFHKSHTLYGLYETLQVNRSPDRIAIVEGYMDVIAMHQAELPYSVAPMGTAITDTQLAKVLRHTDEVVFCFDGDKAGITAAKRALEVALPFINDQRRFRFCLLDNDQDPDTLIRSQGTEAFANRLETSMPLSQFVFRTLMDGVKTNDREGLVSVAAEFSELVNQVPPCLFKDDLIARFQQLTGINLIPSPNIEVTVSESLGTEKLAQLSDQVRTHFANAAGIERSSVAVNISSVRFTPDLQDRFSNAKSLAGHSLPAGASNEEKLQAMKQFMEHVLANTSLSAKHSSGLPMVQLLKDALVASDPGSVEDRLAKLARNQLQDYMRQPQTAEQLHQMASEVNRIGSLARHIVKNAPISGQAVSHTMTRFEHNLGQNLKGLANLLSFAPTSISSQQFQSGLQKVMEARLEMKKEIEGLYQPMNSASISPR
ncbi:DNA primase [Marinobacterium stanieri]|uniref:DNA primase n=1 Tax=Marinobacterium stanieri TaxID=49186 RepID=A0A1N6XHQ7_9GAMM|nr:DNA primase [Marinobacterium stanieri]SIR01874.1 DNA primase, catalytic core [Marinobacterium stanieri]